MIRSLLYLLALLLVSKFKNLKKNNPSLDTHGSLLELPLVIMDIHESLLNMPLEIIGCLMGALCYGHQVERTSNKWTR